MSSSPVAYTLEAGVATIAMDEPETRNALSDAMLDGLIEAFEIARDDAAVRCCVLASTHPTTFSSGGNLAGFAADVPLVHKHLGTARFPELFRLIGTLGKPTVCAAGGHCLAGALGLALACDLVVAADTATFGTPEIDVGVFPFMIMALIYRNVGRKKTTELLLLGERIGAAEAERIGMVNRVVPAADLDGAVADWAARLAAKSPLLMGLGKDAMWRQQDMALEEAWDYLRAQLTVAFATEDVREGVTAFFEKRDPRVDRAVSDAAAVALLCRTSDRTPAGAAGAVALSALTGARQVGAPAPPRTAGWAEDLRESRGCLLEAGGQVDDLLSEGRRPLLLAGDCSVALSTLPVVVRHRPDAWVVWLDAHADFNTPQTSPSGYLGGMPLAGACGLWETGFGAGLDPAHVAMLGVRDVDGGERVLLDTQGVGRPDGPEALAGRAVFVHLDLDVLDPAALPAQFPAPGGWSFARLRRVLAELAEGSELLGAEVTSAHPAHAAAIHEAIGALL